MKLSVLTLVLTCALTLTGCSSLVSLNPFVTEEHSVMDPALLGLWASSDGKDTYWVRQDGTGYDIRYLSGSDDEYRFKARLMVAGDTKLLDLVAAKEDGFQIAVHTPVRVWTEGGTLRVAFLETGWMKEQVSRHLPSVGVSGRLLITAPGESVAAFLAKIGADPKASGSPDTLRRLE